MADPITWLESHGAQRDVLDGLREIARDWRTLWASCPRGDWLLGIAVKVGIDHPRLLLASIDCAEIALDHLEGDARTKATAVITAAREGRPVADALRAFEAVKIADPASEAAARAILSVAAGVTEPDVLVTAASSAAEAEIMSTIDCGLDLAMRWAHGTMADRVRVRIPWDVIAPLVAKLE